MEQMNLQISQILQPTLNVQIVQNNAPVVEAKIVIGGGGTVSVVFGDTMTGTGTPSDPVNVSNDILEQIQNNSETAEENASQISNIQDIIPNTANPQNQLADQGFVNSSIQTATAYFRGDWATWADVPSDPALYPADATGNHTPITNDYMVVIADELENGGTWRYKYTGLWSEQGKDGWRPEYQVNETPLTAAQLAALNSGVTAEDVASFVKKTDYAGTYKAGLVACSQEAAVTTNAFGYLQTLSKNLASYKEASSIMFVGKGTLENIKDDYVKRGITANTIALTDEEKAAAQAWLGVESGGSLPDQTDNAGKFLTTDGTTASWSDKPLVNNATNITDLAIGRNTTVSTYTYGTAVGYRCSVTGRHFGTACAFGMGQIANAAGATQIGVCSTYVSTVSNDDPDTLKVSNRNGNFEMMDANGNVPLGRLTYVTNQIGNISTALTAILGE